MFTWRHFILLINGLILSLPGSTWGNIREFQVSPNSMRDQERSSIAELIDGRVVMVWEEQNGPDSLVWYRILNPADLSLTRAAQVDALNGGHQTAPVVIGLDHGGFAIAYTVAMADPLIGADVYYRLFPGNGGHLLGGGQVAHENREAAQLNPAIISLGKTGFVIAFASQFGRDQDVFHRRFNLQGEPLDTVEISAQRLGVAPLGSGDQGAVDLSSWPDGSFIMVLEDRLSEHIYGIRLDSRGEPIPIFPGTPDVFVSRLDAEETPGERVVWGPRVSAFPEGHFMVVYNTETWPGPRRREARGRFFRADGNAGAAFTVGGSKANWQDPDVEVLDDRTAVVSWQGLQSASQIGDDPEWRVWALVINQSGDAVLPGIRASADPRFETRSIRLASRAGGGWLMNWESRDQDGDALGAYARLVAPLINPPGLLTIDRLSNSPSPKVSVRFMGQPLECYRLWRSTNFFLWSSILTTNTLDGRFEYTTPAPPGSAPGFYRVERDFSP